MYHKHRQYVPLAEQKRRASQGPTQTPYLRLLDSCMEALQEAGGGDYLIKLARSHPAKFLGLISRLLPMLERHEWPEPLHDPVPEFKTDDDMKKFGPRHVEQLRQAEEQLRKRRESIQEWLRPRPDIRAFANKCVRGVLLPPEPWEEPAPAQSEPRPPGPDIDPSHPLLQLMEKQFVDDLPPIPKICLPTSGTEGADEDEEEARAADDTRQGGLP